MKYILKRILFVWVLFLPLSVCFRVIAESNESSSYIYLNDALYNIAECLYAVSEIDDANDSPIKMLMEYINNGGNAALQDEVVHVLEYAHDLLLYKKISDNSNKAYYKQLLWNIHNVLQAIDKEALGLDLYRINQKNKSFLMVEKTELDTVIVQGSGVRLSEAGNITMVDSIDNDHGNIVKGGNIFINNFGIDNTFVGQFAGVMSNGTSNSTGVGFNALKQNSQNSRNTGVGSGTLTFDNTQNQNVAIGNRALQTSLPTGGNNVAVGNMALIGKNGSAFNVAVGDAALSSIPNTTTGNNNVAIGVLAGEVLASTLVTDVSSNVFIGTRAGLFQGDFRSVTNNILIGFETQPNIVQSNVSVSNIFVGSIKGLGNNNTIAIGGQQRSCFISGIYGVTTDAGGAVPVVIDSNRQLTTITPMPTQRLKDTIQMKHEESEAIYSLNAVSFVYNNDSKDSKQYGLVAEEVNEYLSDLVVKDEEGIPYAVRYEVLPVLLLNELKKHQADIQQQDSVIKQQESLIQHHNFVVQQQAISMQQQKNDIQKQEEEIKQQSVEIDGLLSVVKKLQKEVQFFIANNS